MQPCSGFKFFVSQNRHNRFLLLCRIIPKLPSLAVIEYITIYYKYVHFLQNIMMTIFHSNVFFFLKNSFFKNNTCWRILKVFESMGNDLYICPYIVKCFNMFSDPGSIFHFGKRLCSIVIPEFSGAVALALPLLAPRCFS